MSESVNPLSEANPESLADIFAKDPLLLTDDDVERICAEEREARKNWAVKEKKAATAKRLAKVPAPPGLSIDDLDLGI